MDKNITLDELMNMNVISASKIKESNFDSPVDITIITSKEIEISGIKNIGELFKLVRGFIVREESYGNFDIHSKGFDDIPTKSYTFFSENTTTLVMINSRKVYEYGIGGIFWEALPISISDIKKIEIIQSPSSAMYGPNAATAVINIITKKNNFINLIDADINYSNNNSINSYLKYNKKIKNFSISINANYKRLNRNYNKFYDFVTNKYTTKDSLNDYLTGAKIVHEYYADTSLSQLKQGINFSSYYKKNKFKIHFSAGIQDSKALTVFMETATSPLSFRTNKTWYTNLDSYIDKLHIQTSFLNGTINIYEGDLNAAKNDINIINSIVEDNFNFHNQIIQPGLDFQYVNYSDIPYTNNKNGYLNSSRQIKNIGSYLRTERTIKKLRLIGAIRCDYFNIKNKYHFDYQLISTYKFSNKSLLRFNISTATRSPFMYYTYINYDLNNTLLYRGNDSLNLLKIKEFEIGYRKKLQKNINFNGDLFYRTGNNFTNFMPTNISIDSTLHITYKYTNISNKAIQKGASATINFVPYNYLKFKFYGTIQKTDIIDQQNIKTPMIINPEENKFLLPEYDTTNAINQHTPTIFGGITITYFLKENISIFNNFYGMSHYLYSHDFSNYNKNIGSIDIKPFFIWDINIRYSIDNKIFLNTSIKNITNNKYSQFGFTDLNKRSFIFGLNLKL